MLRGVNIGSHNRIKMADLKDLYECLGFKNVKTYIQSGNIVFCHDDDSISKLTLRIRNEIKRVYGFNVQVIIRTIDELSEIIMGNPFKDQDNNKIYITFFSDYPNLTLIKDIDGIKGELEEYFASGRELYLFLPNGYARTKLSNNFFENKLKVDATTRNWRTVNKLFLIAKSISS